MTQGGHPRLLMVFDVSFPFVKGGAQRRFYEVGRALATRGWTVDWLTFKSWEGPEDLVHQGITYRGLGKLPGLYGDDGKRNGSEPLIFGARVLRNLARLRDYDVVWVGQWPMLHVLPVLVSARRAGVPVVLDWWEVWGYELWTRYAPFKGLVGFGLENLTLRYAAETAVLVTDTRLEYERMRAVAGPGATIHTIGNGIPREEIGDPEDRAGDGPDIVSLGRLKNHKRVDLLLEALHVLKERDGREPSLSIIGDGPERDALERMVRSWGLRRVTFHGFISDIREVYAMAKNAKLCAVTTQSGGAGNLTLLEAYGCGLPVVAFRCDDGIDPELVDHGESGLLVSPPTAEALADSLAWLLDHPEVLAGMRAHNIEKSRDMGWAAVADRYEAVFSASLR